MTLEEKLNIMTQLVPSFMTKEALHTVNQGSLLPGETVRGAFLRIANTAQKLLPEVPGIGKEIFKCLWEGWLGPASPVLANFGADRGYPISCYSTHVGDSIKEIFSHLEEVAMLSKNGGGVGVFLDWIREAGAEISGGGLTSGVAPVARLFDKTFGYVNQGGVRKGAGASFINIEHPDLLELLLCKDQTKGDPRLFIDGNIGVIINDSFMIEMLKGDTEKYDLFWKVLEMRMKTGSPYMFFVDNVNRQNPECYKERGLEVSTTNICTEITLFTDLLHTFVCVLSSLNLRHWDTIKTYTFASGRTIPEVAIYLLEAVVTEFLIKTQNEPSMHRARRFAEKSRALGLGVMGYHTYLQSKSVPFESEKARRINLEIFKFIDEKSLKASKDLAKIYGEPEWCKGYDTRHTHRIAIAPTRTNSAVSGAFSMGIEPVHANSYLAKQHTGSYPRKNPILIELLEKKGYNTPEVWGEILENEGSVRTLPFLTEHEKKVFLTAREINQREIIRQASERQPHVCQGQSINLFPRYDTPAKELVELHVMAWYYDVKSLYYLRGLSPQNEEKKEVIIISKEGCPWCEEAINLCKEYKYKFDLNIRDSKEENLPNCDHKTFPKIFVAGEFIGGYEDFNKLINKDFQSQEEEECESCQG